MFVVPYDMSVECSVVVGDRSMLRYIRDKTAAPYFSNLVWFIGGHVLELNDCVQHDTEYVTMHHFD